MAENARPRVAITIGDPNGVGPEIVLKALTLREVRAASIPVVIGDTSVLHPVKRLLGSTLNIATVQEPEEATGAQGVIEVIDLDAMDEPVRPGVCSAAAGRAAHAYIKHAVELCLAGRVQALVTGPISKEALHTAGYSYPGHTELLAELTGATDTAMLLVYGPMRVSHVTTHMRLRDACNFVRRARVRRVIELTDGALRRLGTAAPRIGVAALNPHAGEGGLFGPEEEEEIRPAVEDARAKGQDVEGPIPADTLFPRLRAGEFDAAVAMYHDQGHIPVKLLSFDLGTRPSVAGVNVTLGLPIVRTSVEHGVAFDIAGRGVASEQSLVDAILLAAMMISAEAWKGASRRA